MGMLNDTMRNFCLQTVVDAPNSKKSDLRRARSALVNLAPTSTGSATAIALIFPGGALLHIEVRGWGKHGQNVLGICNSKAPHPLCSWAPPCCCRPEGQAERAGRPRAAAKWFHHRLRVRGEAQHQRRGGQRIIQGVLLHLQSASDHLFAPGTVFFCHVF